jgi:prepilin-type N-terminal cleavage/methylation domain-containing protein
VADRLRQEPRGFTLIEAVVAITVTAIAGAAVLLGVNSSVRTADDALKQTMAMGLAEQLLDEICQARFRDDTEAVSSEPRVSGPGASETPRAKYDDVDDYRALRAMPPADPWGVPLGSEDTAGARRHPAFRNATRMANWRQEVDVVSVDPADPARRLAATAASRARVVVVRIVEIGSDGTPETLAQVQRIVTYVPPMVES